MKLGYCYKTDRPDECPYNLSVDQETIELLENQALIRLRAAVLGTRTQDGTMSEPDPKAIAEAFAVYKKLVELQE